MTAPCDWTHPCYRPDCARCARRAQFQLAKAESIRAGRVAVPLSVLREMLPPPIEPADLADAGPFLITHGYTRPALDRLGQGSQVVLQVEPLQGELAGVPFCLYLASTDFRVQIVDLLRRTGAAVGPCILLLRYLDPTAGTWSFCALEPGGELWDPYNAIEDDPPPAGGDPVPCY